MNDDEIRRILETYSLNRGNSDNFQVSATAIQLHAGSRITFARAGVTAFVGANNCGKSTLLNQLTAMLQHPHHLPQPPIVAHIETELAGTRGDMLDWFCVNSFLAEKDRVGNLSPNFQKNDANIGIDFFAEVDASGYQGTTEFVMGHIFPFVAKYVGAGLRQTTATAAKSRLLDPPTSMLQYLQEDPRLMEELNGVVRRILGITLYLDDLNQSLELRVGTPKRAYPKYGDDRESKRAYQLEVEALPALDNQGDGMRSLLGILLPLITANNKILILDEPEAFLHPPQAFALGQELGRIAAQKSVQVILATHDKNLLAGLLHSDSPLSVVRLHREGDNVDAHQLLPDQLREMWDDPVLKYSNVLDGLFHALVVLAEADRDCRFYEAALDARPELAEEEGCGFHLPATEVLFVPTGGLGGMAKAARTLRALHVPVVASPDIDVLADGGVLRQIVEALDNQWQDLEEDWLTVSNAVTRNRKPPLVAEVRREMDLIFRAILDSESGATYTGENKRQVEESLGLRDKPWNEVKYYGVPVLMRLSSNDTEAVRRLLGALAERAVVLVEAGELESFGFALGISKGKAWVPAALAQGVHRSAEVQAHIGRILKAAQPLLGTRSTAV